MKRLLLLPMLALLTLGGGGVPLVAAQSAAAFSLAITKPGATAGIIAESDDFATTVLGNPWDMSEAIPPDVDSTLHVSRASISGGQWHGIATDLGTGIADPQLTLLSRGYGHGVDPCCAGALHWKKTDGQISPIDADKYHIVSVRMKLTGARPPTDPKPSQGQFFWYRDDDPNTPTEDTVFFPTYEGWHTYTFDLKTLGTLTGKWNGRIQGFRFDPTDTPNAAIDIDWVRLTADPTPSRPAPQFTIQWQATNPPPGALINLTCVDSTGELCSIAQNVPASQGSFTWQQSPTDPGPAAVGTVPFTIKAVMGTDYAALKRGDPWDFAQPTDIAVGPPSLLNLGNVQFNQTLSNGQTGMTAVATSNDPQIWLDVPVPIDAATFKQLTFNLRVNSDDIQTRQVQVIWVANGQTFGINPFVIGTGMQQIAFDMSQQPGWTGQVTALRIDPAAGLNPSGGAPIELGPVTLTTSGADATVATALSPAPLIINTAPQVQVTEPSMSSGPDFATTAFNDPWDFNNVEDIQRVNNSSWNITNGILSGLSFPFVGGDVQVELNTRSRQINTAKYRYLSFKFHLDDSNQSPELQARDQTLKLADGWAARVLWWGPGGPGVDHCTQSWFAIEPFDRVYQVDMATAPIETGTFNGQQACGPQGKPWSQATVTQFRFDPHESGTPLGWVLDYLKLTGMQEAPSSLTIRWTARDPDDGQTQTVNLFYVPTTDGTKPDNTPPTPIATVPAAAGSYTWDTSGIARGMYFIVAQITDGVNTTQSVSEAPFTTSPIASACEPRANIGVHSEPSGDGRLKVTVTASGAGSPLQSIRFSQANGALIDIPGGPTGSTGNVTRTLPASTFSYTFFLRRAAAGQPATAPFTVVDSCGEWPSLAGGGTAAPF